MLMVHYIDVAHWFLQVDHPDQAMTIGDKWTNKKWETPDTVQTLLHYRNTQIYFESTFMNARNGAMLEFMGTEATLYLDRGRLEVVPERRRGPRSRNLLLLSEPGMQWVLGVGPKGAGFYEQPDGETLYLSNWLGCIRTRKLPNAPIDAGISADSAAHLGNLAFRS